MSPTLLIDLDGTLIDPKIGITSSIRFALRKMGIDPPHADDLEWCIGPPLWDSFPVLLDSDSTDLVERAVALYRERFSQKGFCEARPYDGAHDMLESLQSAGVQCCLATSKPAYYARKIIEHFDFNLPVDRIFGSEIDGRRSDKTELIRFVLSRTGALPNETWMLGDRRHDAIGARNNGVGSIGALWGYGTEDELRGSEVQLIARSPGEIPEMMSKLIGDNLS